MSEAKKPQDRKRKQGTVTSEGITISVKPEALDDYELLDALASLHDGNAAKLPTILRRLTGDDYDRVLGELRGDDGRVPLTRASEFIAGVFREVAPNS